MASNTTTLELWQLCDHQIDLILVGDSGVGKSSLLLRFTEDNFDVGNPTTLGIDFKLKTCTINDQSVRMRIWDTAGQERFRSINSSYYKRAHGVVLVYDVTNSKTFNSITGWLNDIKNMCSEHVKIILVGTKNENVLEKEVMTSDGEAFAKQFDMDFIETSSMYNERVEEMFHAIAAAALLKKLQIKNLENPVIHPFGLKMKKDASKCC